MTCHLLVSIPGTAITFYLILERYDLPFAGVYPWHRYYILIDVGTLWPAICWCLSPAPLLHLTCCWNAMTCHLLVSIPGTAITSYLMLEHYDLPFADVYPLNRCYFLPDVGTLRPAICWCKYPTPLLLLS